MLVEMPPLASFEYKTGNDCMRISKFFVSVWICIFFLLLGCDNPFGSSKEESFSTNVTTTISRAQNVYVRTVIDGDTFWAHS